MENKFGRVIDNLRVNIFPRLKEILVVFVYGSVAREDYSLRHSDLDLFIILKKKKITEKDKERLDKLIIPSGYADGVKIHSEYQGREISEEDKTLVRKMIEEGKIIYSSGIFTFDFRQIGLKQFIIYEYSVGKGKTMFSKILHGRKSWYYKGKKKVVKEYKGIMDGEKIIGLGKGVLMVAKEKEKDLKRVLRNFGVEYKFKKIVYV